MTEFYAIGLMSGTSLDGIDAALVRIETRGVALELALLAFMTHPFDIALREAVRQVLPPQQGSTQQVCELNFLLGESFAQAAQNVAARANVPLETIACIASHGQTVYHQAKQPRSTLQIAHPAVIAARTGCTVVSDFRARDMALGGQGAPLVPWFDALLFRHQTLQRVLLNIGGMANVSYVPPSGNVIAFDTGPGNVLLDEAMRILSGGEETCDWDGATARRGKIHKNLLDSWLAHPYFQEAPPKSTGRGLFGPREAQQMLDAGQALHLSEADIMATLTAFTARSITQSLRFLPQIDEMWVGGGGAQNEFLMEQIAAGFPGALHCTDENGLPSDAKEAIAFAVMGYATLHGWPCNLPSATGAREKAILGSITPGRNFHHLMRRILESSSPEPTRLILR